MIVWSVMDNGLVRSGGGGHWGPDVRTFHPDTQCHNQRQENVRVQAEDEVSWGSFHSVVNAEFIDLDKLSWCLVGCCMLHTGTKIPKTSLCGFIVHERWTLWLPWDSGCWRKTQIPSSVKTGSQEPGHNGGTRQGASSLSLSLTGDGSKQHSEIQSHTSQLLKLYKSYDGTL